jgi:aromatic amino acid aminotransferase I
VVAQPAFIEKLTFATDGTTSNPSGFAEAVLSQLLLREWGIDGFVRWIDGLRINYLGRRNLLCEALAEGQDLIVTAQPSLENQHSTNVELHDTYVLFPTIPGPKKRKHTSSDVDEEHRPGSKSRVRMYEFRVPPAGFYVWVQINLSSHPLSHPARDGKPQLSSHDIILRLWKHLVGAPYHLLTLPGNVFAATPEVERDTEKDVGFLRLTFAAVEVRDLTKVGLLFGEALKSFWEGTGWDLHADGAGGVQTSDEMGALDTAGETKRVVKGYLSARGTRIC